MIVVLVSFWLLKLNVHISSDSQVAYHSLIPLMARIVPHTRPVLSTGSGTFLGTQDYSGHLGHL